MCCTVTCVRTFLKHLSDGVCGCGVFLQDALKSYSDAIKLDPSKPLYYTNRAQVYLKLKKLKSCIDDCNAAIQLDERCWKAWTRRGEAREQQGHLHDAIAGVFLWPKFAVLIPLLRVDFEQALKITPPQQVSFVREAQAKLKQLREDYQQKQLVSCFTFHLVT